MSYQKSKCSNTGVQTNIHTGKPEHFGLYCLYYDGVYVGEIENPSTTKWSLSEPELAEETIKAAKSEGVKP